MCPFITVCLLIYPGTVNWALPLTVGNGGLIFPFLIKSGTDSNISEKLLLCTGFARMFLLGVSMNCGFIGGIIFPFLTIGMIAGTVMYIHFPYIPQGLCVGSFMISVACGIVPMPFTFSCLVCFIYYFGIDQTVPIFVASFVSYLFMSGSGLMKKLANRAANNDRSESVSTKTPAVSEKQPAMHKAEADDFALKQYLGNKRSPATEATH
jgi:H+/Cl- antiporter ClcA